MEGYKEYYGINPEIVEEFTIKSLSINLIAIEAAIIKVERYKCVLFLIPRALTTLRRPSKKPLGEYIKVTRYKNRYKEGFNPPHLQQEYHCRVL